MQPCFSRRSGTRRSRSCPFATRVSPRTTPTSCALPSGWSTARCAPPATGSAARPASSPGGWFFEYENEFYPDTDDTAEVLAALAGIRFPDGRAEDRRRAAVERGICWQLGMQNADGGWGAFDRDCDNEVLTWIPFADHNAMIDPSCEDITGRTLEALDRLGLPASDAAVAGGIEFLARKQEPDGTWYGRWGCNYIYGTWLALRGLKSAGVDLSAGAVAARGELAAAPSERGRRLGRASALLRRSVPEGDRAEHAVADGVGADGAPRARDADSASVGGAARVPALQPAVRRVLEGRALDGNGVSEGLLPALPPVRDVLPALGARLYEPRAGRSSGRCAGRAGEPDWAIRNPGGLRFRTRGGEPMRFPLHLTTGTIANQMRAARRAEALSRSC